MATYVPSNTWNTGLSNAGSSSLGNPADLGPYRGMQSQRGQKYDDRADYMFDWGKERAGEIDATGKTVTQRALDTGSMFNDWAKADRGFWEGTYKPAMQEQMDFARGYTTDARKQANRGAAMSDVGMTFDAAADMSKRALQGYGINPNSGAFVGLDAGLAANRAKALAGAGTKSDRDTEMLGQEYLARAINTGAALPGQAVNEAGVGIAANNQAVNTGIATGAAGRALQEPTGWVGAGDEALKEWKNSLLQQTTLGMQQNRDVAEQQLAAAKLAQGGSSGAGAAIGGGMGMLGSLFSQFGGGMMGGGGGGMGGMMGGGAGPLASIGSGATFKEGGMVPRMKEGGMVPHFFAGGMSGFSAPDIKPIDWGGGQAFDPYDPMASAWGAFDNDNPELEDNQGEGIGRGVGGTVGGLIGQIWGPIGSMAGREIGQKVGGGIGAAVQGDWGGAAESLAEGTPLDMFFDEGGQVPDEAWDWDDGSTPEVSAAPAPGGANMVPPEASPSGGAAVDDVTAQVSAGEFVVPKDVTAWYGEKYMQGLIDKARKEMQTKTAAPTMGPPPQAMAISPTFQSEGAMQ